MGQEAFCFPTKTHVFCAMLIWVVTCLTLAVLDYKVNLVLIVKQPSSHLYICVHILLVFIHTWSIRSQLVHWFMHRPYRLVLVLVGLNCVLVLVVWEKQKDKTLPSLSQVIALWANFMGFTNDQEPLIVYIAICWGEYRHFRCTTMHRVLLLALFSIITQALLW